MDDAHDWQSAYPAGVSRTFEVPGVALGDLLARAAAEAPDRVALTTAEGDVTYDALHLAAVGVALSVAGATRSGDRVVARMPNGLGFAAVAYGTYLAGRALVPLAPDTPEQTVRDIARRVGARLVLDTAPVPAGTAVIDPVDPSAPAVLQHTSGTTGGRKAATMSHRNLVANALQNNTWFGWSPDDVVLGVLPFCHTWGLSCVLHAAVAARARIVVLPRFDAAEVLDAIERERVTVAYGSATMFHRLLDAAGDRASRVFDSLRYVKAGAMLVGGDLVARWTAVVQDVPMVLGYGLTEASPEVCNNPPHAAREGTVGVPLPGTELRLCAPDDPGRVVDGEGELQVRGPQVTSGYWDDADATAAAFAPDGWLRTGDLACFDDAGYVRIVDRLKDLIKFRGHSVVPGGVEAVIRTFPGVADAVVVGAPHPVDGETPVAFVESVSGVVDLDALAAHVAERLPRHDRPRRYEQIDAIPRNHVGKPLRRVLRERAASSR